MGSNISCSARVTDSMPGVCLSETQPHTLQRGCIGHRSCGALLCAKGRDFPGRRTHFARSAYFKATDGPHFWSLRAVLCVVRNSYGAARRSIGRQAGAGADRSCLVCFYCSDGCILECCVIMGNPVPVWSG